jgi:hypothetical protein
VIFLLHLFEPRGAVEHLQPQLQPGFQRLLLQDRKHVLELLASGAEREGEPPAAGVDQDAVVPLSVEAGLGEVGAGFFGIVRAGGERGMGSPAISVGPRLQAFRIAPEILRADRFEVHGVMEPVPHVEGVEHGFRAIDPDTPVGTGNTIVELVAQDASGCDLRMGLGQRLEPELRCAERDVVEVAACKRLDGFVRVANDFEPVAIRIEAAAHETLFLAPPALHPAERDGPTLLDVLFQDFIGSQTGQVAPLVALQPVVAEVVESVARVEGHVAEARDQVRFVLRVDKGEGVGVENDEVTKVRRVEVVVPRIAQMRAAVKVEREHDVVGRHRATVRPAGPGIEVVVDGFGGGRERPAVREKRHHRLRQIGMRLHQTGFGVVAQVPPETTTCVGTDRTQGAGKVGQEEVIRSALFGGRIGKHRQVTSILPR